MTLAASTKREPCCCLLSSFLYLAEVSMLLTLDVSLDVHPQPCYPSCIEQSSVLCPPNGLQVVSHGIL